MKEALDQKKSLVQEFFEDKAKEIKEGGSPKVNLSKIVKVEFTKDFGYMRKGKTQNVSQIAYEIYKKAKCIKVID